MSTTSEDKQERGENEKKGAKEMGAMGIDTYCTNHYTSDYA